MTIEQISEFCNKIRHPLIGNRAYIYNKINISKPLLKLLNVSIKVQHCNVNEVCFLYE